jgi:4-diphosphocytidyl-2-C-methyl-D-erythritol kinase
MIGKSFTLPSFAKINWHLRVVGKRTDGFHEICTVFQSISLHDSLSFSADDDVIRLTCSNGQIPIDESNLIMQAATTLRKSSNVESGARIHLEKVIPSPGGLGGGSSNAAVAMIGLARLWGIDLSLGELTEIGSELGSDVPFFFCGGTAIGTGRGAIIEIVKDVTEEYLLIVSPGIKVSTKNAFRLLEMPHLTNNASKSILQICRDEALALKLRQNELVNDFEKAIFLIEPEIERVKKRLIETGAIHATMSGSGASVFAVFDSKEKLQFAFDELQNEPEWEKFVTKTVSRPEYFRSLGLVESLFH